MYKNKFTTGRPFGAVMMGKVSPMLSVPLNITLPEYAKTGIPEITPHIMAKHHHTEYPKLRKAARLAQKIVEFSLALAEPGISTDEIDRLAHAEIVRYGAYPTLLNYYGFPKSIRTSVNEVVCSGIPDSRILEEGNIISIDVLLYIDGYHGGSCGTTLIGNGDPKLQHLIDTTKTSVTEAIKTCRPGSYVKLFFLYTMACLFTLLSFLTGVSLRLAALLRYHTSILYIVLVHTLIFNFWVLLLPDNWEGCGHSEQLQRDEEFPRARNWQAPLHGPYGN